MFIVAYTLRTATRDLIDTWTAHDTLEGAQALRASLSQRPDLYAACTGRMIESTDRPVGDEALGALWSIWEACESMELNIGALDDVADAIEALTGDRPDEAWRADL